MVSGPNRRQGSSASDGFRRAGIVSWSLIGCLLLAGLALYVLYFLRVVIPPIALALILIFLLNPLVNKLERRGIRRGIGTALIYLIFLGVVILGLRVLVPPLGGQINALVQRGPQIQENAIGTVRELAERMNLSLEAIGLGELAEQQDEEATGPAAGPLPAIFENMGSQLFAGAGRFATGAIHVIVNFILAPVFAAYLLIDLPKIQRAGLHYMPPSKREEWLPILERIGNTVGSFFRGQLLVAFIVGVMSCLAFLIIGLPFWLPIGLLAGFFNIIPLIGPFVGGGVAVLVGSIEGGLGLAIKAALAMLVVQQVDNHFVSPKVMGWAVRLHPVAVMIALLLGASVGGIFGMLLAVPMMGVGKILFVHFYETRILGNWEYQTNQTGEGLVKDAGEPSEIPADEGDGEVSEIPAGKEAGGQPAPSSRAGKRSKTRRIDDLKEAKKGA